jgi:O-acetylhomoserine (thiol)-lyase
MNRCPKIEYGRLSSEISWMGVNSRTLSSKRAPMPTQGMRLSLNRMSVGGGETAASDRAAKNKSELRRDAMRNNCFDKRGKRSTTFPITISESPRLDGGRRCDQHAAHFRCPTRQNRTHRMTDRLPGFSTLAVHAGAQPDPTTGARATPIYQTTSFVFNDADHAASLFGLQAFGNIYTRIGNPTNAVLEERVAALEGGTAALAVASGHAAQVVVLQQLLMPGDEFIAARKLYGGSINQFTHAFKSFGWNVAWADPDDIGSFERAVTPHTKAIFIESIANPAGSITDIEAIAAVARKAGVPLIVDNTLATPYLIRPIDHGADIVVHSLTKFLGGHGNSLGGIIVDAGTFDWSKDNKYPMLSEPRPEYHGIKIQETFGNFAFAIACRVLGLRDLGPALSPFNAFLILTGIETLPLRMQKHCENAKAVAEWLSGHPAVAR